jgi:hypothetical protein
LETANARILNGCPPIWLNRDENDGFDFRIDETIAKGDESHARCETFLQRSNRLSQSGNTDAGLDIVYDAVDELLRNGEFDELNQHLAALAVAKYSTDILIGLLTATLPARRRLSARPSLLTAVEATIRERGEYGEGILTGLDG